MIKLQTVKQIFALVALLFLVLTPVRSQSSIESVQEALATYHTNFPQEKVYVHHDKPVYVLGETLWFKAYLLDAIFHQIITPSQLVRVELFDPENTLVATRLVKIEDGGGPGDINLDPTWTTGKYLLRAYTDYQRNFEYPFFFEQEIVIFDAYAQIRNPELSLSEIVSDGEIEIGDPDYTLDFFPEGGSLVDNLSTTVGVRFGIENGVGEKASGVVKDISGDIVARFSTHKTGLGFFDLKPSAGIRYTAYIEKDGQTLEFNLPRVETSGYNIRVQEKRDTLLIRANTNIPGGLDGAYIVGHMRGIMFGLITDLQGESIAVAVPLEDTPDGVLHFTLFTPSGNPVSERLTFVYRPELHNTVDLVLENAIVNRKSEVNIDISSTNIEGENIPFNGSITVTDLGTATPSEYATDIRTYLLLESDIKGVIENPGFYFEDGAANNKLVDVLMLTHGWRRFEWETLLKDPTVDISFYPENGLKVQGYVTRINEPDKPIESTVFLSMLGEQFSMLEQVTGEDGQFEFIDLPLADSLQLLIQAEKFKGEEKKEKSQEKHGEGPSGNRYVDIQMSPVVIPIVQRSEARPPFLPDTSQVGKYFSESRKSQVLDSAYSDMLSVQLEEVVIKTERTTAVEEYYKSRMQYSRPDARVFIDSVIGAEAYTTVFDFLRGRVPGVEVIGQMPYQTVRIRGINSIKGNTTATIMLDGMAVEPYIANNIPMTQIAFVDVIRGLSSSAVLGEAGANGIVAIYRKRPEDRIQGMQKVNGSLSYMHPGYDQAQVFYAPNYGDASTNTNKPDYRTTLYWNPNVRATPAGANSLSFYTSDQATVFAVRLEAICADGTPVVVRKLLEVQ